MSSAQSKRKQIISHEIDRLKRRILSVERAGADQGRQLAFLYRAADRFARAVYPHSFCQGEAAQEGCNTGKCCKCGPDVFEYERRVLDLLPKRSDQSGYCPFFNLSKRNCGIYQVRPFACRIYYNFDKSAYYCQNPNDTTLQLFDGVQRHLEKVLGAYTGGYYFK
ncbi:YkgJ family cysteine cluster protein [Geomesophilobacter sediminis]|uniref:YkgJ family cysteine cluster protein n=1 Tax=Geomesophilobacter sediminis TaxID=2798584 RepID=A0A8J7ILK3_9BACT|nr:YkgJ family cysteine cluster protein [Geomesophilobacter sediminis]MBJ6723513.1 YkgJ family cysteine cluster protein [Geomesophilobacter sediminis]